MRSMLEDFCNVLHDKHGSSLPLSPGKLAEEFITHAGLSSYPSFLELHSVLCRYGISEIRATDALPPDLRGYHCSYKGSDYTIEYEADSWAGRAEFTMGHELYEIIQEKYKSLYPNYTIKPAHSICYDANKFSAALLMQAELFHKALYDTGFDIVQIHHRFYKSCSAIAIRACDLAKHSEFPITTEFIIAVYERKSQKNPREWGIHDRDSFLINCAVRSPGIKLGRRGPNYRGPRYPRHLIPKRKDKIIPESIADLVCDTCKPVYLEKATGFDFWGWNDLSFIARPVFWYGKLAKIVLVGVRYEDRHVLQPQLEQVNPIIKQWSHQLI